MKRINILYFSPTGNVKKIAQYMGKCLSERMGLPALEHNISPFESRQKRYEFDEEDILIVGFPVYAGRLPNKILPFIQENLIGKNTVALPFVSFGNRSFDDALSELVYELKNNGFNPIGGAAICSEHAFAGIASGHPDESDMTEIGKFLDNLPVDSNELKAFPPVRVDGNTPPGPYYVPKKTDGSPAVFLKAKPVTDKDKCTDCKACAKHCPMMSIDYKDTSNVPGICIKCQGCVHICGVGAKYFDNPDFLSHKQMLEENFTEKKINRFFIGG